MEKSGRNIKALKTGKKGSSPKSGKRKGAQKNTSRKKMKAKLVKKKLRIPVANIHGSLCQVLSPRDTEAEAVVYLSAAEEYAAHEILELASNRALTRRCPQIEVEDVIAVVNSDPELHQLFGTSLQHVEKEEKKPKKPRVKRGIKKKTRFAVAYLHSALSEGKSIANVESQVPIYLNAIEEYVAHEILELAVNSAISRNSGRVEVEDVMEVVRNDPDLNHLVGHSLDD